MKQATNFKTKAYNNKKNKIHLFNMKKKMSRQLLNKTHQVTSFCFKTNRMSKINQF